jgi:hypothetical protein
MSSCFIKRPKLIRLMPVFPSGAGLKNRASGETQGPEPVRRARLVCGKTKRRHGVAADADPPCETDGLWPPRGAKRPWIKQRPVQTAAKPKERTACGENPAAYAETGWHSWAVSGGADRRACCDVHARMTMKCAIPSMPGEKEPNPDEVAIFDTAAPPTHLGANK